MVWMLLLPVGSVHVGDKFVGAGNQMNVSICDVAGLY